MRATARRATEHPGANTLSRSLPAVVVLVLVLAMTSVPALAQSTPAPAAAPMADVPLPAPLERVLRDYERHWRAGDAAALALLFAEGGFILQNHRPPVRGRQNIQSTYEALFQGKGGGPLRLRALAYTVDETTGILIGAYGYDRPGDVGKFTLTLHREPGQPWLIFSDMDNQNASAKPAAQP